MKIISSFHDYYDTLMRYDEDRDTIYFRETKEIKLQNNQYFKTYLNSYRDKKYTVEYSYLKVGFCGKLYPAIYVAVHNDNTLILNKYFYSRKALYKQLSSFPRLSCDKFEDNVFNNFMFLRKNLDYFTILSNDSYFLKYKVPIFILRKYNIILNPQLKQLNFQVIFDVQKTYQELVMYFGGPLSNNSVEKIPPVSNNDLIQAKGFDLKTSFRQPPKNA